MSWLRQVKVLYTVTTLIFTYILWSIIAYLILDAKVDYKIYIITTAAVLLMQYLRSKFKNKILGSIIPDILAGVIFLLFYPLKTGVGCTLYTIIIMQLFYAMEEEDIQYDVYRSRIRSSVVMLIFVGLIFPFVDRALMKQLFRFYLIYLICGVIVLREARIYANKLQNKKTLATNMGIIIFVALASTDFVYGILVAIGRAVMSVVSFVLDKILIVMTRIFVTPFSNLIEKLRKMLEAKGVELEMFGPNVKRGNGELPEPEKINPAVILIMKIVIALLIIYFFYRLYKAIKPKKKKQGNAIVEQEKIHREKVKKNKGIFSRMLDRLFRGGGGPRNKIRELYRKFEERMDDREIYKTHMTATQLSNVAKTQIDERDALDQITLIYNEAKFSEHEMGDEHLNDMKEGYNKLKKF